MKVEVGRRLLYLILGDEVSYIIHNIFNVCMNHRHIVICELPFKISPVPPPPSTHRLLVARPLRGHGEGMSVLVVLPAAVHDDLSKGILLERLLNVAILRQPLGKKRTTHSLNSYLNPHHL